jgi:hypothetical protein
VRDHNGQQLAYVYFEDEPGRRSAAKLRSRQAVLPTDRGGVPMGLLIKINAGMVVMLIIDPGGDEVRRQRTEAAGAIAANTPYLSACSDHFQRTNLTRYNALS